MSTNFPTGLDTYVNPTGTNHLNDVSVLHSAQHANINDAVEAIEQKIGIDFSNINNSLDFIIRMLLMTQVQHQNGGYKEVKYKNGNPPIVESIIWYIDSSKTIKLVEKNYSYGSIPILPNTITLKLYDGTISNVLKRTITDTIIYSKVFEISRTRIIT